ncbi:MAG TPA: class I SAM-dependent methyltransferase [Kofleriaceae bacterium]|nr:class I SAM-dependent methyltransferase [Kofleriaceae bacterium]
MPEPTEPARAAGGKTIETIDEARRTAFDRMAELYDAARPSYPVALVDDVLARAAPRRILEIGAGTGKATVLFARAGCELVALEPGANLAATLRRNVAGLPQVTVEEATFEAYAGGGFDLVYAAQALHWIDPAVRYTKAAELLRPGGALAAIRNETQVTEPALQRRLDAAYERWFPEGPRRNEIANVERRWVDEIDASGRFGPVHVGRFPWMVSMTTRGFLNLLDSYSDHALLPEDRRRGLYAEISDAVDGHGGRFELPYIALVCLAIVRPRA